MRLIDADALFEQMKRRKEFVGRPSDPVCLVEDAPTIDAEQVSVFKVLERISTAYWGKQMFFMQDSGTVYDRYHGEYVTLEQAIERFVQYIAEDGID